ETILRGVRHAVDLPHRSGRATNLGCGAADCAHALDARDLAERALRSHRCCREQQPGNGIGFRRVDPLLDSASDSASIKRLPTWAGIMLPDFTSGRVEKIRF